MLQNLNMQRRINIEIWWLSIFIALFFIAQSVYAVNYFSLSSNHILRSLIRFSIWSVSVFIYLICLKTNPIEYLKLRSNVIGGIIWGFLIGAVVVLYYFTVTFILYGSIKFSFYRGLGSLPFDTIKTTIPSFSLSNIVFIFSEEVLFRGFILQKISESSKFWVGNIISAVLFVLVHILGWILLGNFILSTAVHTSIGILVFALIQGIIFKKTNSLWTCVIIHIINNAICTTFI